MRRSTPWMGEGVQANRPAWTAARLQKSAFRFTVASDDRNLGAVAALPSMSRPDKSATTAARVPGLWSPKEVKIKTDQEEDEMDDGAATADLRCFGCQQTALASSMSRSPSWRRFNARA